MVVVVADVVLALVVVVAVVVVVAFVMFRSNGMEIAIIHLWHSRRRPTCSVAALSETGAACKSLAHGGVPSYEQE